LGRQSSTMSSKLVPLVIGMLVILVAVPLLHKNVSMNPPVSLNLQTSSSSGWAQNQKNDVAVDEEDKHGLALAVVAVSASKDDSPRVKEETLKRERMELQRRNSTHCWRTCPHRINKIYFEHGRAGLGDRLTVIENLAQIAGYLCAILEMPPPSISLALIHNNGNLVSKKVKWLDFRNLTFLQDDSQVVRGLDTSFSEDFDDWKICQYTRRRSFRVGSM
jgi:hypothetical protein